ncbi:hypothetical protein NKR19_g5277 [Coniochaeta hoffmannii]|uniref:Uncharacterized protein n=1 Tax=Coniochaeta hoffmannii TaxID=91930 RepID=A0AA38VGX7_9PEZI|nr:hypothetical protein NKR19_g5277 [Coniochaeta hoffmannii]
MASSGSRYADYASSGAGSHFEPRLARLSLRNDSLALLFVLVSCLIISSYFTGQSLTRPSQFRAYTDPFNTSNNSSLNPPSIPPPPPPPPPLNVPPSRARLQLAARLAMHKRSAETSNADNPNATITEGGGGGGGDSTSSSSSSSPFTILQAAPELTRERERDIPELLRDPFADDEEDDDGSGSGSDEEGAEAPERSSSNNNNSGWHRGGWWRGVVRNARGRSGRGDVSAATPERFGDGRDDDDSDDEGPGGGDGEDDDEEFGDFAMPEAATAASGEKEGGEGKVQEGEQQHIVKPLPLHPGPGLGGNKTSGGSSASPFGSLWPFSSQGFGMGSSGGGGREREREEQQQEKRGQEEGRGEAPEVREEPLELGAAGAGAGAGEAGESAVLDEDGKQVERAVEATRRTSIEDPDEDEGEVIVGRGR